MDEESKFYIEEVATTCGTEWQIRRRADDGVWAKTWDKALGEKVLETAERFMT